MTFKRRKMRDQLRAKSESYPAILAEAKETGEQAAKFIKSMLTRFEEQYNVFLSSPDNRTPALKVSFNMEISRTSVPEAELRHVSSNVPESLFQTALRDTVDLTQIQVMYLRIDKVTELREHHQVVQRPGAPEQLIGNTLTNLLYHAAVLLTQPAAGTGQLEQTKHEELEVAAAKRRLTDDLITHVFINGIQYQESSNERQWQLEHKMQTSKMKEKAQEVNDIFENAANMKVSSN